MKHTPPKWKVKRWPRPKWADGFVTIVAGITIKANSQDQ